MDKFRIPVVYGITAIKTSADKQFQIPIITDFLTYFHLHRIHWQLRGGADIYVFISRNRCVIHNFSIIGIVLVINNDGCTGTKFFRCAGIGFGCI